MEVLQAARTVQSHSGGVMPLLVDEKVHYSVLKMLYCQGWQRWDVRGWLGDIPVLYGVWHPYKEVVNVVYRRFYPIISLLELGHYAVEGAPVYCGRKVRQLEALFGALLVVAHRLRPELDACVQAALDEAGEADTDAEGCSVGSGDSDNTPFDPTHLLIVKGLQSLLLEWVPALFCLGFQVRSCNWDGRPRGSNTGVMHGRCSNTAWSC